MNIINDVIISTSQVKFLIESHIRANVILLKNEISFIDYLYVYNAAKSNETKSLIYLVINNILRITLTNTLKYNLMSLINVLN